MSNPNKTAGSNPKMANKSGAGRPNRICRDFVNGTCHRKFCCYPHVMTVDQVSFCHDFQNATCPRIKCKFIHVSIEDEEHYRKYGKFPSAGPDPIDDYGLDFPRRFHDENSVHHEWRLPYAPPHHTFIPSRPPPFLQHPEQQTAFPPPLHQPSTGTTAAQNHQLQQHSQQQHQQIQQQQHIQFQQQCIDFNDASDRHRTSPSAPASATSSSSSSSSSSSRSPPSSSRRRKRISESCPADDVDDPAAIAKRFRDRFAPTAEPTVNSSDVMAILRRFEEEHNMLRRRVETAELKIAELRATNDYLLSQNTQFRLTNAAAVAAAAAVQRGMASATVTTVSQPQATMINAVSIASVPLQANTPTIVSMAGPQIIASTSCGTPLSISANTTQGQQMAALAQQSLNTLSTTSHHQVALNASAQILGTSQITLTPTLATAPSMGLTLNTSQPISCVSNASQPIISYPVMTHSILPH